MSTQEQITKRQREVSIMNLVIGMLVGLIPGLAVGIARATGGIAVPLVMFAVAVGVIWWRIHKTCKFIL